MADATPEAKVTDPELLRLARKAWPKTWPGRDHLMVSAGNDRDVTARVGHDGEDDEGGLHITHPDETRRKAALHAALLVLAGEQPATTEPVSLVAGLELLSAREREVVGLLCKGTRLTAVAKALHISVHTARNHLKQSFRKLGVHSQNQLIATYGGRHG